MDLEADAHEKFPEKSPTRSIVETRQASWCAAGVFCCLVATMGLLNSVACFRLIYRHRIFPNHTPFQLSWIFSIQRACLWAFGPLYGRLCDMYGPRVVIWPLAGTCAFQVFAMSLLQDYWYMMETQGFLFGIAAGGVYTASLISMGQWFDRRLGLVTGIAACGSSLGGIVYPLLLQCAMEKANFENAMQYTALLIGIFLAPSLFLINGRLPITGWNRNAKWFELTSFRQRHYPYFIVGSFLTMWGYWAPIDYIMQYALDSGTSPLFALLLLPSMSAASIPGHVIFGHLGDRLGHDAVLTLCSWGLGTSFCILWVPLNYTQSATGIFAFTLAFGFLSGGFISLLMPCVARLGSAETLGQRFGSFQFVMAISCLTGLPIMEAIRTLIPSYLSMQLFALVSIILGSAFLVRSVYILAAGLPRTDV